MPLTERFKYALHIGIVSWAFIGIAIALGTADAIEILPNVAFDWFMAPWFPIAIYVMAFIIAPKVSEKLPSS